MENTAPAEPQKAEEDVPTLTMKMGGTTYLIGLHFNSVTTETVDLTLKRLIKKNLLEHRKDRKYSVFT